MLGRKQEPRGSAVILTKPGTSCVKGAPSNSTLLHVNSTFASGLARHYSSYPHLLSLIHISRVRRNPHFHPRRLQLPPIAGASISQSGRWPPHRIPPPPLHNFSTQCHLPLHPRNSGNTTEDTFNSDNRRHN
jgi:hypothetical protein